MRFFSLFSLLLIGCFAFGQETPFHNFNNVGKYNEAIKCIAQDANGRLLLGTQNGLLIYTGYSSRKVSVPVGVNKDIKALFVNGKKVYALNAQGIPLKLSNDTLKPIVSKKIKGEVTFLRFEKNKILFYTKSEVIEFNEPGLHFVSSSSYLYAEEANITASYFGDFESNPYHVISTNELILVDDQEARTIPSQNNKIVFGVGIDNSIILAGSRVVKGAILSYKGGQFKKMNIPAKANNAKINALRVIHGQLMIFTDNGCVVYSKGLKSQPSLWFHGIGCSDGLVDNNGNLWIATKSKGLILVPRGKHRKLIEEPVGLIKYENGSLIMANNSASIVKLDRSGNIKQRYSNEALDENISFVSYDKIFKAYFVQNGILTNDRFIPLPVRIHGVHRAENGTLYLATSKGLISVDENDLNQFLKNFKKENYLTTIIPDECFVLSEETNGEHFLVATNSGVYELNEGVAKEIKKSGKSIRIISATWYKDSWYVVTTNNSLYQLLNGKVVNVKSLNTSGVVNPMKVFGTKAYLYFLTESGLYRTKGIHVPFESFRDVMGFDGLYIRDFTVYNDEIFLATQSGLFTYLWKDEQPQLAEFILGSPFSKDKKETKQKKFLKGALTIPVECIALNGNHNFHLQYRLINDGMKGSWVEVMPEIQAIDLSNLATGKYKLEVRMIDPVSGSSTKIQSQFFEVPTAWYQIKLLWVGVGVALVIIVQWFMRKLRKAEAQRIKTTSN